MSEETNANISLQNKVPMQCSLFTFFSFNFLHCPLFYGRYFPLYSSLELSSFYTCSSSNPPLEQLSHQFSSSAFLNDNILGNTIQRSTPHKCGHNGRYSAFNVEVAAFHRYFGIFLPLRVSVRYFYMVGTSCSTIILVQVSNLNRIQQIRGGISPRKAFLLFPMPKILVNKPQ